MPNKCFFWFCWSFPDHVAGQSNRREKDEEPDETVDAGEAAVERVAHSVHRGPRSVLSQVLPYRSVSHNDKQVRTEVAQTIYTYFLFLVVFLFFLLSFVKFG